jgi:hypothetical protein
MGSKTVGSLRVAFLSSLTWVCLGCPNPQLYSTPRTVGHGNFSHSIAAEGWGFSVPSTDGKTGTTTTLTGTIPTFPTYTLRIGLGDKAEIGARIANMSSLGADFKFNFIRSPMFDLAIDPGAQVFSLGSTNTANESASVRVVYLHAPVMAGINLARSFSLVLSPGVTYGIVSGTVSTTDGQDSASATTGVLGRFGVGFNIRVSPGFAVHPEVTFLRTFKSEATMLYMVGVGFNFGTLPNYDDVGGGSASPPPGAGPPPGGAPPPGEAPPPGYAPPPGGAPPPPPSPP